jgi:hypothetical protein
LGIAYTAWNDAISAPFKSDLDRLFQDILSAHNGFFRREDADAERTASMTESDVTQ